MLNTTTMEASEAATLARFSRGQERLIRAHGYSATAGAQGIIRAYLEAVANNIRMRLSIRDHTGDSPLSRALKGLTPEVLALCSLNSILHGVATGQPLAKIARTVGEAARGELWAAGLLEHDTKLAQSIERKVRREHSRYSHRLAAAKGLARASGYRGVTWAAADLVRCGMWLVDATVEILPDVFTHELIREQVDKVRAYVFLTPKGLEIAERAVEYLIRQYPVLLPCTEAPKPWTGPSTGGFWDERTRLRATFLRTRAYRAMHAAFASGQMQPHLDAVNALQAVPWRVNTPVLRVMQQCIADRVDVPGLPLSEHIPLPERLPEELWANEDRRYAHKRKISQIRRRNHGITADRALLASDMALAAKLEPEQFYTPANCDWRGRVYSIPHFAFGREDRVRGLFMFADGMPIGEEGLYWLKVHTANCGDFGKISKRPFEERVAWVDQHSKQIDEIATTPFSDFSLSWWTQADKPFQFLAASKELHLAQLNGPTWKTHLPVCFDGSCSGLQHLCAMIRAPEGALVNLTPQAEPQDIYETVAERVRARVSADAATNPVAARCLENGITRKLLKRNVMTYGYSSKRYGMAQQHLEDTMRPLSLQVLDGTLARHPYGDDHGRAAAKYLADTTFSVIEEIIRGPAEVMGFLRKLAKALAHEGKPLTWVSPTGIPWMNAYHEQNTTTVSTYLGEKRITLRVGTGSKPTIDKISVANGVAPNFVHALDASHLALVVNACVSEGITQIATVHDSFGCLAPQAPRFRQIIREQFVQMYTQHDVLQGIYDAAFRDLTVHNQGRLPSVPVKGALNLGDMINAEYSFA